MNRHQLTSIAVAMACFFAVGVAATTLSSTLSSDPSEAVDLNYQYLPVESSDISDFQQKIETKKPKADLEDDHPAQGGRDGTNGSGMGPEAKQPSGDQPERRGLKPSKGDPQEPGDMPGRNKNSGSGLVPGNGSQTVPGGGGPGESEGGQSTQPAPKEADSSGGGLLPLLVGLLLVGLLAALTYRYRERLAAMLFSAESTETDGDSDPEWEPSPPSDANVVFDAWDAMMRNLEVENTPVRTTGECATAAANAGMDPDAVRTLKRTFEEVRYGKRPVTDDRRQRVSQVCQRLQIDVPEGGV